MFEKIQEKIKRYYQIAVSYTHLDVYKRQLYYIVKADEKFVWLSDGKLKDTASPKRKNRKHIQVIKKGAVEAPEPLTNEAVKRIIKQYLRKEL